MPLAIRTFFISVHSHHVVEFSVRTELMSEAPRALSSILPLPSSGTTLCTSCDLGAGRMASQSLSSFAAAASATLLKDLFLLGNLFLRRRTLSRKLKYGS